MASSCVFEEPPASGSSVKPKKAKKRGLGFVPLASVSLAEAREKSAEARRILANGGDPRSMKEKPEAVVENKAPTFREAMKAYIVKHKPTWSSAKHAIRWERSLETYSSDIIDRTVDEIETREIEALLDPNWLTKIETSSRVRQRMERIFSLAVARGNNPAPNPAAWRDNLEHVLPAQKKVVKVKYHAAVSVEDAPKVFAQLWERRTYGFGYAALIFVVLTGLRSGEVRHLIRDDLRGDHVIIPSERMKARLEHAFPITPFAARWIGEQPRWNDTPVIFAGRQGKPMSDMTMGKAQKAVAPGTTVHGWRLTFRDWAAQNGWDKELAEYQLAHAVGNATEQAYQRDSLIERRKAMMCEWEKYLCSKIKTELQVVA